MGPEIGTTRMWAGMKVVSSNVLLASEYSRSESYTKSESLRIRLSGSPSPPAGDRLTLSADARQKLHTLRPAATKEPQGDAQPELSVEDRIRVLILEKLLGVKIKILARLDGSEPGNGDASATEAAGGSDAAAIPTGQPPQAAGPTWGVAYDLHESYQESEQLSVSAKGIIMTADGQEIAFDVQLNMSRQFAVEHNVRIRAGNEKLTDPIVINYDGPAAELTDRTFSFDLNGDGQPDQLPALREGSGFLALDQNGDGQVTNGSELFGPATGDGFAELIPWDTDQNGWLDANDPVWDKLRIWTKDSAGNDLVFTLAQKDIGAIFLGNIEAGYTLKDAQNQTLGQNQKAGVFIREDGTAGTVQQLDLKV